MPGGQKFSKIFHRKILSNLFGIISCFFRNVKRFQKFICFLSGQTLRAWASLKYQSYMHITKLNQLPGRFVPTGFWQSREITADMSDVNDERYMRKFYDKGKNYGDNQQNEFIIYLYQLSWWCAFLGAKWRRAHARNVGLETLCASGQFTLNTNLRKCP